MEPGAHTTRWRAAGQPSVRPRPAVRAPAPERDSSIDQARRAGNDDSRRRRPPRVSGQWRAPVWLCLELQDQEVGGGLGFFRAAAPGFKTSCLRMGNLGNSWDRALGSCRASTHARGDDCAGPSSFDLAGRITDWHTRRGCIYIIRLMIESAVDISEPLQIQFICRDAYWHASSGVETDGQESYWADFFVFFFSMRDCEFKESPGFHIDRWGLYLNVRMQCVTRWLRHVPCVISMV